VKAKVQRLLTGGSRLADLEQRIKTNLEDVRNEAVAAQALANKNAFAAQELANKKRHEGNRTAEPS